MMKLYSCATVIFLLCCLSIAAADEVRYVGDHTVELGETVNGDVVMVTGNLTVKGQVNGSVVAYLGDIHLESTAVVTGSVVTKKGRIYQHELAVVNGKTHESWIPDIRIGRPEETILSSRDDEGDAKEYHYSWKHRDRWSIHNETDIETFYNKVDGLYLGLAYDRLPFSDYGVHFRSFGSGGYAFASQTWQGRIGFGAALGYNYEAELAVDAYYLSYSEDSWYMSDSENSLAAFFIHEDFRDYYLREGAGVTLTLNPWYPWKVAARYQSEQHGSLETEAEWALFGGDKVFRPNLPADEGMLRSLIFSTSLDTRDDEEETLQGWWIQAEAEITNPDMASDFDYRKAVVDVRRYQPLTYSINLDTRVRVGNSDGTLPLQKRFYLGGPSTLPGFGLKEFSGSEFALFNAELRLHDGGGHASIFDWGLSLFLFTDIGMASDGSLLDLETNEWANDIGVGLAACSGQFRIQMAKRTDTSDDPYTFMLRLERPF